MKIKIETMVFWVCAIIFALLSFGRNFSIKGNIFDLVLIILFLLVFIPAVVSSMIIMAVDIICLIHNRLKNKYIYYIYKYNTTVSISKINIKYIGNIKRYFRSVYNTICPIKINCSLNKASIIRIIFEHVSSYIPLLFITYLIIVEPIIKTKIYYYYINGWIFNAIKFIVNDELGMHLLLLHVYILSFIFILLFAYLMSISAINMYNGSVEITTNKTDTNKRKELL